MKSNIKKLFMFGALVFASSLTLSACLSPAEEAPKEDTKPSGDQGGDQGGETVKTSFPAAALKSFLSEQGLNSTVPSPVSEGEWTYEIKDDGGKYFEASVADSGTVGTNSIEDTYKALLENTVGWKVDDTEYDEYGYLANDGVVEVQFYTEEGKFNFWAYEFIGSGSDLIESDEFPDSELQAFLTEQKLSTVVPSPDSQEKWQYNIGEDETLGVCFYATTTDSGTVGTNSIEDTYTASLTSQGWAIDKSNYDEDGIYATKGDVEVLYFTFYGSFELYVHAYSGSDTPVTPDTPDTEGGIWTLVSNASELSVGDVVVIGDSANKAVISTESGKNNSGSTWLKSVNATFSGDTIESLPETAAQFTLGQSGTNWTLSCDNKLLGSTKVKNIGLGEGVTNWSISISSGNATIQNATESYGRILYNVSSERFTTYTSNLSETMLLPQIYKLSGESGGEVVPPVQPEPKEKVEWTIMIYMCGSTLESDKDEDGNLYALASEDIAEILKVKNQPEDVNIIIETGGASQWSSQFGISAKRLERWHIEDNKLVKDTYLPQASMGKASTFQSFLEWGLTYYPAEKFGLFMWNHGGAMDGCCFDENFKDDSLTINEVNTALTGAKQTVKRSENLEFIAYDACLMAVQDVVEMNSHHFNYMLASQESESGYGYDYDAWLPTLYANPKTVSTSSLLQEIGETFLIEEQQLFEDEGYPFDQTQSVYDLSKAATYKNAFEEVAKGLSSNIENETAWKAFVKNNISANDVQKYGIDEDGEYLYDIFDVEDVLDKIATNYPSLASKVTLAKSALKELVIWEDHGDATSGCGLNIFCPINEDYNRYYEVDTNFVEWYELCQLSGLCIDEDQTGD